MLHTAANQKEESEGTAEGDGQSERTREGERERENELEKATLSFRAEVTVSMVTREYPALQLVKNGATEEEPVRSG